MTTNILRILCLVLLTGCAYIFNSKTKDPDYKLKRAHYYITQKSGTPAEKLILDALELYRDEDNQEGIAESYFAYATLYRTNATHHHLKLPNFKRSAEWYEKTSEVYRKIQYFLSATQCLILAAKFSSENQDLACGYLEKAKNAFNLNSEDISKFQNPESALIEIKKEQIKYRCN